MSDGPQGPGWWQASDGKWYPPQAGRTPPPPPGRSGASGCLKAVLIAVAVLAAVGIASCVALVVAVDDSADEVDEDLAEERAEEAEDVAEPTCTTDAAGYMVAELEVTNNSSERSNYIVEVTFEGSDGNQIDSAFAEVTALEPGQTGAATAQTLTTPPGEFMCRVVEVERLSDEP